MWGHSKEHEMKVQMEVMEVILVFLQDGKWSLLIFSMDRTEFAYL